MENKIWCPVENREYTMPGFAPGYTYTLRVDDGDLEAWSNDFDNKHQDGSPRHVEEIGIGEWRVCQLVTTEDTAPCVPDEVLEALQTLTYLAIEMADEVWIYHDETEMHALDSGVRRAGKIVREWLETQKGED